MRTSTYIDDSAHIASESKTPETVICEQQLKAVYIHWPFCKSKCPYCSFVSIADDAHNVEEFENSLLEDLKNSMMLIDNANIESIFFGGGTPSLMSPRPIYNILNFLYKHYKIASDVEISLEANPGTFDEQKIANICMAGINRISLGIQSFSDKNLKFLGRIYDQKQAELSVEIVARHCVNFNLDFMFGFQNQSPDDINNDLTKAFDCGCKHVSCYQLTIEDNTPFQALVQSGDLKEITENQKTKLYNSIVALLEQNNFMRYEISNFAKKGFECKHNLFYWNYENYLGVGPGAHSRIVSNNQKIAIAKINDPILWHTKISEGKDTNLIFEHLSASQILQEILIMGLRLTDGISLEKIYKNVSEKIVAKIISPKKIAFLHQHKILKNKSDVLQLTKKGLLKADAAINFLLEFTHSQT